MLIRHLTLLSFVPLLLLFSIQATSLTIKNNISKTDASKTKFSMIITGRQMNL